MLPYLRKVSVPKLLAQDLFDPGARLLGRGAVGHDALDLGRSAQEMAQAAHFSFPPCRIPQPCPRVDHTHALLTPEVDADPP